MGFCVVNVDYFHEKDRPQMTKFEQSRPYSMILLHGIEP
jgi:hypothetical protein